MSLKIQEMVGQADDLDKAIKETLELTEKVSKDLALATLSMNKNQKFVKAAGDFVPEIYLSAMDRDKLKKEFGRLPRGFPNQNTGMTVVSLINYALGNKDGRDPYDTEDGDSKSPKLYNYDTGKVVGKPKTVGDAARMAGLRLESVELDEGMKYTHVAVDKKGLVIGFASDERDAKDMARRNDGKVVKLKKPMSDKKGDMMVNRPFKEEVELDEMSYKPGSFKDTRPQEKGAKAFDKLIQSGGVDKKTFQKAKQLYVQASDPKSRMKLRDFIYNMDTEPLEAVMDLIGRNDPETFVRMYPDADEGERLSTISFRHKQKRIKTEELDDEDIPKVKKIIGKLKKASDAHAGQAKDLQKAIDEKGKEMSEKLTDGNLSLKDTVLKMWKEAKNPAQQAAIAIAKKEKEKKEEPDEGNLFGKKLKDARDKGEKTFTIAGKTYDVEKEEKKLDPVNPKAVKKKFDDRKDKDIDNDGDVDDTDKFLHKRRKAISKAINKEDVEHQRQRYLETKRGSLRDAILQMWGEDAHSKKDDEEKKKNLTKEQEHGKKKMTDTGKEMTPVDMKPKMPKIKNEKNKV